MAIECDIAVIGGGVGGYVGAIRAAQLGARVVLIEKDLLGGTCLNRGCIPSKALLDAASRYETLRHAADYGLSAREISFDFARVQERKNRIVQQLRTGVETLIKGNGITYLHGVGSFIDPRRLQVRLDDGRTEEVAARSIVIATGSVEARPPIPGLDLPGVFGTDAAFTLTEVPTNLVIIGGGAVGVEFATMFSAFGSKVTIVEMLATLLPNEDPELGRALAQQFQRRGIEVRTETRLEQITQADDGGLNVMLSGPSGATTLHADRVMVAIGRAPYTEGLGIERLGIEMNRRYIKVNQRMETNIPGIYAVGDVCNGIYAHVASAQGEVAVENALGHDSQMDYRAVPGVTFCQPQVASVGLTEEQARATGQEVKVGRFPFAAVSKAVILGETGGFIKIVADAKYGQVLGVQMIGPEVTDLIAEAALAVAMEATVEDVIHTIHAHPTLPEGVKEATLDVLQRPIHVVRRRRA
ncbi:MAG: dihydrolipoyl dehydrogenase [Chloroflexi bacterium]|nr:dihydrolipoyl dehydrogenase [Chloroflexota bacterium]